MFEEGVNKRPVLFIVYRRVSCPAALTQEQLKESNSAISMLLAVLCFKMSGFESTAVMEGRERERERERERVKR